MKNILVPICAFLVGFSAVLGYQYIRTSQTTIPLVTAPVVSVPTPEPTFALVPPSSAVSGVLSITSGHAKKLSRNETEYKEASTGAQILLGESVSTGENSSTAATFSGIVNVSMGPVSELVFANLFPSDFVLQQKSGEADYTVTQPISVRALHSLVAIGPGETTINIIDTDMSISVKSGSVKFALVDIDNNTKVYNLEAGQRANIDDVARQVYFVR